MTGVVVGVGRCGDHTAAIGWASTEAALRGLPLTLVHAWNEPVDLSIDLDADSLPGLAGVATACAQRGGAAGVLLGQQPELLVLGRRADARHLSHLARACVHHAACPVVIVPDTETTTTQRVLVGVSRTGASRQALEWAAAEAQRRCATLVVVQVWQLHPASARDFLQPDRALPGQQTTTLSHLHDWVQSVLGATSAELHATHGGPLDGLLHASADADLIVLGRSVHSGLGRILHGTVGDDVSGLAACPIAVIPADGP
jgi:nucleotide-binding universal stress UspA family protein